ncbi:hypothetical protein HZB03_02185 [Candidatus Woesearchaeota archaeon]|nr:hypothetical protein [Candidatus Woesearchaeota archaeon]
MDKGTAVKKDKTRKHERKAIVRYVWCMRVGLTVSLIALLIITTIIYIKYQRARDENWRWAAYSSELRTLAGVGELGSTHEHIVFMLVVDGKTIDFSGEKYQERSPFVHVEDGIGDVIHKHATGVTFRQFLGTLGITVHDGCLVLDTGKKHCATSSKSSKQSSKTLRFFVNEQPVGDFGMYELKGGDSVLLVYGDIQENVEEYLNQLGVISDRHK